MLPLYRLDVVEDRLHRVAVAAGILARVDAKLTGKAPVRLQRIAVLAMAGVVLRGSEQQPLTPVGGAVPIVLDQAEGDLLVVRVVADLAGCRR